METNHDHELPLLQGQANGASNNTNATNTNNSVGEDDLIESELGSEIDHVIGAVVDSEEKKKEKQREHTKQHDRKRKQENITASRFPLSMQTISLNFLETTTFRAM
ncbi:hypothetical protein SEMRO_273_G105200.1 [Seminavis robusta]|uniref:Uncharacterized protein n=1 Tax=Seminavis robusta TaxID=568900 RepID=A0A9N8DQ19_9STRA|nr:hypothetical protein SEMRO_273_G105200.1 [Seminavis robusta]|eukprot:Sro273_g105200.1 n/a (106) ;mRNA; f:60379-60696